MRRRGLLAGLLFAPAIIRTPGLLMAVKPLDFTFSIQTLALTMQEFMERDLAPDEFFIPPWMITEETLKILKNNLIAADRVNLNFVNSFARIGATLTVRPPVDWGN